MSTIKIETSLSKGPAMVEEPEEEGRALPWGPPARLCCVAETQPGAGEFGPRSGKDVRGRLKRGPGCTARADSGLVTVGAGQCGAGTAADGGDGLAAISSSPARL